MKASKLVHKILKFINYANLCTFTEPRKGPGGAIGFFFILFFYFFIFIFLLFFFMSLPGRNIYIFLTLIFFFLVPSRGINVYFLTSRKLYHMKFAIFDVARCRMSATSLTFLFHFQIIKTHNSMHRLNINSIIISVAPPMEWAFPPPPPPPFPTWRRLFVSIWQCLFRVSNFKCIWIEQNGALKRR